MDAPLGPRQFRRAYLDVRVLMCRSSVPRVSRGCGIACISGRSKPTKSFLTDSKALATTPPPEGAT
jgi:hypothetical protein